MQAQNNLGEIENLENSLIVIENYIHAMSEATKNSYLLWDQAFLDDEGIPAYEFLLDEYKLNVYAIGDFSKYLSVFCDKLNKIIANMISIVNKSKEPNGSYYELKRGICLEVKVLTSFSDALSQQINHFMSTVTHKEWSSNSKIDCSVKKNLYSRFNPYTSLAGMTAAMWVYFICTEEELDSFIAFILAMFVTFVISVGLEKSALITLKTQKLLSVYDQMMTLQRESNRFSSLILKGCFSLSPHARNDYYEKSYKIRVDGMINTLKKIQEVLDAIKTDAIKKNKEILEYFESLKLPKV